MVTNLFTWGHFAPSTYRIHAVEQQPSFDIQTHWDSNSINNNISTIIYNNSEPISSRSITETENNFIRSCNNGINVEDINGDSSDYESSIDDDEDAYERCMMEDTETNHAENEDTSMDYSEYPGTI